MLNINIENNKYKFLVTIIVFMLMFSQGIVIGDEQSKPITTEITDGFDECDTVEVIVDEIINPPNFAKKGNQYITANFTNVIGINVNGIFDIDNNEPWFIHETSPDINGTPKVNIYTSCDDDNIYLAFENLSGYMPVLSGKIFIDTNMNDSWDGPFKDNFLTFNIDDLQLKDNFGYIINDSQVGWGNFVELKIPKMYWSDCNKWAYCVSSEPCDSVIPCIVNVPEENVTSHIELGSSSIFNIEISNIENGYDVYNDDYLGWCIEFDTGYNPDPHPTYLHSSYCPPQIFSHSNWSYVNYILNNKQGEADDIQKAIWYFINFGSSPIPDPSEIAQDIINDTIENGNGFIPMADQNQVIAVICEPVIRSPGSQYTIIEVEVPSEDCSCNPNWGNNSNPNTFPPNNEFLNFTCDYGYNCSCGIAFKALADIYRIHPGDCDQLYHTNFEEDWVNISKYWKAISLDNENSDTWKLSTNRSNSSSHSYHCTGYDEYYGNAIDVLEMNNSIDLSNVINVSFSFWSWCEGDSYPVNNNDQIADYGDIEFFTKINGNWSWISLSKLGISNIYYDNDGEYNQVIIDKSKSYNLNGEVISGEDLLQNGNKFRFVWVSDPQFQYEGWYIDDITIMVCEDEIIEDEPIWQSHSEDSSDHFCVPFDSTIQKTFPIPWNVTEEGKYLLRVCTQEEPPWCGMDCKEKRITIGDVHDIAVIEIDPPVMVEQGEDLHIDATIKNVGTVDKENIEVQATIKKDGVGPAIWMRTATIDSLNVSEEKKVYFTWENTTYCDYLLEIVAILPEDDYPLNNSKNKWILVATTIFNDPMDNDSNWDHYDLTGGEGHWGICTSGYDDYLWCGLQDTTKYDNDWNDVAIINQTFNLSNYYNSYLFFDTYYEINESDYGYVEISTDNGRHWNTILGNVNGNTDWISYNINITPYKSDNVQIRFRFFSNESITDRGWIIDNVTLFVNDTIILFNDDFESGLNNNWIIQRLKAGNWWQIIIKEAFNSTNNSAWWCGDELINIYPANLNNSLTMGGINNCKIDLRKAFDADLIFTTFYNISTGDTGFIEISYNDGASWNIIGTLNGISGIENPDWINLTFDISDYIGNFIKIRFRFESDNQYESNGWYIDNVIVVAKIDDTPPVTTCDIDGVDGLNNWFISTIEITLDAEDDYSGVKDIYYKLDGGSQSTYTSTITVSENGDHSIEYWSEDNVGNIEEPHGSKSFKIDTGIPTLEITKPEDGIYWRDNKIWPIINWSLFDWSPPIIFRDITIIAAVNDYVSGINYVEFYIDNINKSTVYSQPFEWNWDERAFSNHTIKIIVNDNAGNSNSAIKDVRIFNINLFGEIT